nr:immunoglobulin light chain junction region [Macaca mulatta]MPO00852.1 immunoglobulin light chain junction region [Macaca mulatta]
GQQHGNWPQLTF